MEEHLQRPLQEESHERDVSHPELDEQPVITGTNLPLQTGFDLEKPISARDDRHDTNVQEPELGDEKVPSSAKPDVMDLEEEHAIRNPSNVRIGDLEDLEEDPQSPLRDNISPSNYQTKLADPTGQGGKEADVGSLVQGLDKDRASKGLDKGVSVKDYLTEKLRPGDEDKALSKAIAEKLHIKKKTIKVEDKNERESSSSSGVVGMLKGVVGSWLGNKSTATTDMDRGVVATHRE